MDGRAELQRVILHYEQQRADAIRAKQEAEIVLPFVRAALEELDAATGQSENSEVMERVQAQVESARAPQESAAAPAPTAFPREAAPRFTPDPHVSIASLIEEAKQGKAG